jgi:hypothetical protein
MATIVTRAGKGSPLTNNEVDANFENLNAEVTPLRHSIRPSLLLDFANSKQLDPRITFSRASTGTYYDGKTFAKAEENLLTYSQEFNQSIWNKVGGAAVTADSTTAPDGTTTADLFTVATSGSQSRLRQFVASKAGDRNTFSCYVKGGTNDYVGLVYSGGANWECYIQVDLTDGSVISSGDFSGQSAYVSSSVSSVGNDWYRIDLQYDAIDTTSYHHIYMSTSSSWSGFSVPIVSPSGTLYVWGAQVEQRSSVTAYTPTTDQPITNYIPVLQTAAAGTARFDHDPVTGESKGLLIEEQRTNLASRSYEFNFWTSVNTTIVVDHIAPDGTLSASTVTASSSTDPRLQITPTVADDNSTYTGSVYVKKTEGATYGCEIQLKLLYGTTPINKAFSVNTNTGAVISGTGSVEDAGGYWRISDTITNNSSGNTTLVFQLRTSENQTAGEYTVFWGAQLEAGAFPTSYIKTTSAQATRNEDQAEMSAAELAKVLNVSEGTAYISANLDYLGQSKFIADIGVNSSNYMGFLYSNGNAYFQPSNSSVNSEGEYSVGLNKQALSWDGASSPTCYNSTNSVLSSADNGTGVNSLVTYEGSTTLRFGNPRFGTSKTGWVTKFALYPKALSTSELQALTEE